MLILVRRFATQELLLTLLLLGDIGVCAQSTLNTTFFYQSKLGRDVEFQNTHIVLLKSPVDVMRVTTLGTQLVLGSELVDWYLDATSVAFRHLVTALSPRTDDRIRYCTNSGSVSSKLYIPDHLRHLRTLDEEHTKSLYSSNVAIAFSQLQKPFSSVLPKRVYPGSIRMHSKSTQKKFANHKKHHVVKFQDEVWLLSLKRLIWKQRRDVLSSEKRFQLIAVITPLVLNHLSWFGTVCSCPSFRV